jgi:hypothetical protein
MRIIFYIMDGVSARKIRSYNNDNVNELINKNMPLTYLDKLYQEGFSAKNCYGFDTTQNSFYAFMTGLEHYNSSVSSARSCNLLDYDRTLTIPSLFKKNGYKTHYFSNNYIHNPAVLQDGYEEVIYDNENYDISSLNIPKNFNEYFGIDNDGDLFLTIHDFYTHDQDAKYSNGKYALTTEEYEELIIEHSNILENNLKAIQFDKEKDYLFLISDHGMTVDSSVFKDKGDDESLWSINSKELKARVMCNIIGPDIKPFEFKNICTLRELFYTFVDKFQLHQEFNNSKLNLLNKPNQKFIFSLNAGNAAIKSASRITFHQFMCVTNDRKKYIYQDNIDKDVELYSLTNDIKEERPSYIKYDKIPLEFKAYIEKYQNSRQFTFNHMKSFILQFTNKNAILYLIRNYKKIPKKLLKIIGFK